MDSRLEALAGGLTLGADQSHFVLLDPNLSEGSLKNSGYVLLYTNELLPNLTSGHEMCEAKPGYKLSKHKPQHIPHANRQVSAASCYNLLKSTAECFPALPVA